MASFIKIENLKFAYLDEEREPVNVLSDISLDIKRGEFISLLGHNGCGKSTLAKCLNALIKPSSGKVFVSGIDTLDESRVYDIRSKVGLVLQNPENQIVAGVVEDDVAFGPENLGIESSEIRKRVDDALKAVGMYEYRKMSPYKLSGGQKQRVAIAGIIAMKPECIVLDEPTSMLDPVGREEVLTTVKKLNKDFGITVIFITHFMDEAILADKVLVMSNGKIVLGGSPREVFANVDLLKKVSLAVPQPTQLVNSLCACGLDLPRSVLTGNECINVLKSFLNGKSKKVVRSKAVEFKCENEKLPSVKLKLEDVSFYYGKGTQFECKAIDCVNAEFYSGEFVSVIGHTGSGKTTLIQMFNGLIKPCSGKVYLDGEDINLSLKKNKETKFKVGLVFQYPEYQLFEETVSKDIAFGPTNMGLEESEIKRRVLMAAEFVGLDFKLLSKSPFELSGGEQRKAAIAGIIAMDPDVLILDEPTAGLDPLGKKVLLENIRKYHKIRKNTIIMVSHSMEDVAELSDRVLVMNNGKIEMFDSPKKVFSKVRRMEQLGLSVPKITKIMYSLRNCGACVDDEILTVNEAVNQIKNILID